MESNYSRLTDIELTEKFLRGKPSSDMAFREIYRRYGASVRCFAKCMTLNSATADEVFQDTFVALYRNLTNGVKPLNLKAYLLGTARNLYANARRNKKITVPLNEEELLIDESVVYEQKELLNLILQALPLLSDKYREAFVLREFDGMPYADIAETLGISLSGAKTRVARAHQSLQKVLDPYLKDLCK